MCIYFCNLVGANSIKTDLQSCNLQTGWFLAWQVFTPLPLTIQNTLLQIKWNNNNSYCWCAHAELMNICRSWGINIVHTALMWNDHFCSTVGWAIPFQGLFFSSNIMVFDFLHFVFFQVQYIHYCWKHYVERLRRNFYIFFYGSH